MDPSLTDKRARDDAEAAADAGNAGDNAGEEKTEAAESVVVSEETGVKRAKTKATRRCGLPSCAEKATKRCTACKAVWYCSREHQQSHWTTHKIECGGKAKAE